MGPDDASLKMKAADLLLKAQQLTKAQHDRIAHLVKMSEERSEESILDEGLMSEPELLKALASLYRTQFVTAEKLAKVDIPRATVQLIAKRIAQTLGVFPVVFNGETNTLSVVTSDPDHADLLREVQLATGVKKVSAFVARPRAIAAAISKHHDGDSRGFGAIEHAAGARAALQIDFVIRSDAPKAASQPPNLSFSPPGMSVHEAPTAQSMTTLGGAPASSRSNQPPGPTPQFLEPPAPPPPSKKASPSKSPSGFMRQVSIQHDTTTELLSVMISLLENNRSELRGHSSQVARFVKRVCETMNLDRDLTHAAVIAAHIHDLGKMGKFHLTALNCSEYEGHKIAAQKAFDTPLRLLEAAKLSKLVAGAVSHMYERFDGKGFPDGLSGKEIPLAARILAVADTYADLTQNPRNPYRKVLTPPEAVLALATYKDQIFDPALIDLFETIVTGEDLKAKLLSTRYSALVVDADPEETTVLELRMIEQGFEVRIARSIEAAKKMLPSGEFELVVSELDMPDGDGLQLLAEARRAPWGKDLPWVVYTRKNGRNEAQKTFELGGLDFITKPQATDVLVAKLKILLEQQVNAKRVTTGVSGSLSEMGLPDLVQVLTYGKKSGKLSIRSGAINGEIHFANGEIVHAEGAGKSGNDAFYAFLRFKEGDFALDPAFVASGPRTINDSGESLLLEGMRRMDEEEK